MHKKYEFIIGITNEHEFVEVSLTPCGNYPKCLWYAYKIIPAKYEYLYKTVQERMNWGRYDYEDLYDLCEKYDCKPSDLAEIMAIKQDDQCLDSDSYFIKVDGVNYIIQNTDPDRVEISHFVFKDSDILFNEYQNLFEYLMKEDLEPEKAKEIAHFIDSMYYDGKVNDENFVEEYIRSHKEEIENTIFEH